jgi:Ni,Fe-hydrogenase III small subunit
MSKISVYRFLSAGCNGCDVQILECLAPRYRLTELGVEVVEEPERANVLVLTGGMNIKGRDELLKAYEKINPPKIVVAVGNCALTKEIFDKSYMLIGPPDQMIPVNYYIPGCPPRPQAIIKAIAEILGAKIEEKEDYWLAPEGFRGKHEIDKEKCMGCGACAQICTADAIEIIDGPDKRIIRVNYAHCSFCAFCQDECPTQAIRLTKEYHLLTSDRQTAKVTNEVNLANCRICGNTFMPQPQIEWALKRIIEEKIPEYREYQNDILRALNICTKCRKEIKNIVEAKKLLVKLSEKARKLN